MLQGPSSCHHAVEPGLLHPTLHSQALAVGFAKELPGHSLQLPYLHLTQSPLPLAPPSQPLVLAGEGLFCPTQSLWPQPALGFLGPHSSGREAVLPAQTHLCPVLANPARCTSSGAERRYCRGAGSHVSRLSLVEPRPCEHLHSSRSDGQVPAELQASPQCCA